MSQKAIISVWESMKEVPDYMKYLQLGDYAGLQEIYLCFGENKVFSTSADSIKKRLEKYKVSYLRNW